MGVKIKVCQILFKRSQNIPIGRINLQKNKTKQNKKNKQKKPLLYLRYLVSLVAGQKSILSCIGIATSIPRMSVTSESVSYHWACH